MADSPYITWYTSDFLNGISAADMTAEQIGVYTVILALIGDSAGPIADDPAWIGRRCNISTRRAGIILAELEAMPNKIVRRNGLIGNKRMLAEVAKRDKKGRQARDAANVKWERWREDHKPQLPFDPDGKNGRKKQQKRQKSAPLVDADASDSHFEENETGSSDYPPDNPKINPRISSHLNSQEREISADPAMRTHLPSRAGVIPEPESIQTNDQETLEVVQPDSADRPLGLETDLMKLLEAVCAAAGFAPSPGQRLANAVNTVRQWRDLGVDFDKTVLPVIHRTLADSHDPTSSLLRFDKLVRHEHARAQSRTQAGAPAPRPLEAPRLKLEDETPEMLAFRTDLLERIGSTAYCLYANHIRLAVPATLNGSKPLRVIRNPSKPFRLIDAERAPIVRSLARKHGFTEVWEE